MADSPLLSVTSYIPPDLIAKLTGRAKLAEDIKAEGVFDETTGAKGVGEPPVRAGYGAVMNATTDVVGVDAFRGVPITPDLLMTYADEGRRSHDAPTAHMQSSVILARA